MLVIVVAARLLGWLFERLGQPAVIGEIVAGILLGPSLLGAIAPGVFAPSSRRRRPAAEALCRDRRAAVSFRRRPRARRRPSASPGANSRRGEPCLDRRAVLPGSGAFPGALPRAGPVRRPVRPFALFMGIAMSITAFPVLVRILRERGLSNTPLGNTAITCAAVDDVTRGACWRWWSPSRAPRRLGRDRHDRSDDRLHLSWCSWSDPCSAGDGEAGGARGTGEDRPWPPSWCSFWLRRLRPSSSGSTPSSALSWRAS